MLRSDITTCFQVIWTLLNNYWCMLALVKTAFTQLKTVHIFVAAVKGRDGKLATFQFGSILIQKSGNWYI